MDKKTKLYLLIAFTWTWIGWIGAYLISNAQGMALSMDGTVFSLWTDAFGNARFWPQLMFTLAVYGPFIGFLAVSDSRKKIISGGRNPKPFVYYIFLIPLISILPAVVISSLTSYFDLKDMTFLSAAAAVLVYFISNVLTSGTEEFGWRGVLYPAMKARGMSFWSIAWKGGLIWALWHFPLLFMMYLPLGPAVLIPSLIGFVASIVAMNFITNFIYEKTNNIWFAVILHALNNTASFVVVLLFPGTPFTILSSIMAWAVVWWIEKKYPKVIA